MAFRPGTRQFAQMAAAAVGRCIGTEGHVALKNGRRFVGAELKRSYYEQACRNLAAATQQLALF